MPLALQQEPEIIVNWETPPIQDALWDEIYQFNQGSGDNRNIISLGTILLSRNRIAHVGARKRSDVINWHLYINPQPKSSPPEAVKEQTARVGGSDGVRKILEKTWLQNIPPTPPTATYQIKAILPKQGWECIVLPKELAARDPSLSLDKHAAIEQIGYRLNGPLGLTEIVIIYFHEDDEYSIRCLAKGLVSPTEDLTFPYAESGIRSASFSFPRSRTLANSQRKNIESNLDAVIFLLSILIEQIESSNFSWIDRTDALQNSLKRLQSISSEVTTGVADERPHQSLFHKNMNWLKDKGENI